MTHVTMPLAIAMFLELAGSVIAFGKEAATVQIDMVIKAKGIVPRGFWLLRWVIGGRVIADALQQPVGGCVFTWAHLNSVEAQNFKLCDVKVITITGTVIDNSFVEIAAIQANT